MGVDAKVALEWHRRRQSQPEIFTSRFYNKFQYVRYALQQVFRGRDFSRMCSELTIEADGVIIPLPADIKVPRRCTGLRTRTAQCMHSHTHACALTRLRLPTQGIIILNIASYGGGSNLWGVPTLAALTSACTCVHMGTPHTTHVHMRHHACSMPLPGGRRDRRGQLVG